MTVWGPWFGSRVASVGEHVEVGTVDAPPGDPTLWVVSVSEVIAHVCAENSISVPTTDVGMLAWLAERAQSSRVRLDVSGCVVVRDSDNAVCVTVGNGWVAEPFGDFIGLVKPSHGRYRVLYRLPFVDYMD